MSPSGSSGMWPTSSSVALPAAEGRPSTAFHRLARLAMAPGAELWYHGTFDRPGVAIAADVTRRSGARPWRMTAADYLQALRVTAASYPWPDPRADPLGPSPGRHHDRSRPSRLRGDGR